MSRRLCALVLLAGCTPPPEQAPAPDAFGRDFRPVGRPLVDISFVELDVGRPDPSRDLAVEPVPEFGLVPEEIPLRAPGLMRATDLAFLPNPKRGPVEMLVTDKDGTVHLLRLGPEGAEERGTFHISDTYFASDAGLIALTLAPDFNATGHLYVALCLSVDTNVIRRYTLDRADVPATAETAVEVLRVVAPGAPRAWHNLGSIGFTDSGAMWALMGDKVQEDFAQDPSSLLGSLLLFTPDPEGGWQPHPDNDALSAGRHPLVYAKGLRSPWRGTWHAGRWYVGDVGQDRFEELNRVDSPGQSLGWPELEGPCPNLGTCGDHRDPLLAYGRGEGPFVRDDPDRVAVRLRSIWVGPVYRPFINGPYGDELDGHLIFGDFYSGFIRALDTRRPFAESRHVGHLTQPAAMRQGPDGHLYAVTLGSLPAEEPVSPSRLVRLRPRAARDD